MSLALWVSLRSTHPTRAGRVRHSTTRHAGAVLLYGGSGQHVGAGEGCRLAMSLLHMDLVILDELRLSAVLASGRGHAVPSAVEDIRAHQRHHHHEPDLRGM